MFFGKKAKSSKQNNDAGAASNSNTAVSTGTHMTPTSSTGTSNSPNAPVTGTDDAKQQQQQQQLQQQQQVISDLSKKLDLAKLQIGQEKAGKRKIFHSLVKIANELKKAKEESVPLLEATQYANQPWYEGGIWRNQVQVLPGVVGMQKKRYQDQHQDPDYHPLWQQRVRGGEAVSLSDLFLDLVIVTAFTRVGEAISTNQSINGATILYFAVFWTIWSKEASYSSRFDTSDLSAKVETLLTCFAVLFGSLSASAPINSNGATRIMMMAAFCAILHCMLHIRVALVFSTATVTTTPTTSTAALPSSGSLSQSQKSSMEEQVNETRLHVKKYGMFNAFMTLLEAIVWIVGMAVVPVDSTYRWVVFLVGVVCALRVPRSFLENDFHAACSKRGVLFILLLGFLMQSIVVVSSAFFEYESPSWGQYSFVGACCLILFCIKLLYVDDSSTAAKDHALLVNRTAAFLFSIGQFCLLLSTTVMGSGLNLVTHEYLAATAALPGPSKRLVAGGFSAVILSNFFIKSMHVKRVPSNNSRHRSMFVAAYVTEMVVTLAIVLITALLGQGYGGPLQSVEENGTTLIFVMSGFALFLVLISWLDEGVELSLYDSAADSLEFRIEPFGIWSGCLGSDLSDEAALEELAAEDMTLSRRLSAVTPLLGRSSAAFLKEELRETEGYGSMDKGMAEQV